jgi:hypothetical protein
MAPSSPDAPKPWERRPATRSPYQLEKRDKRKAFLIICEGANTEPLYFKSFPVGNAEVETFGLGASRTALVEQVIRLVSLDPEAARKEVWVVFDLDLDPGRESLQMADFDQAIRLAERRGYRVAWSNDAFELWFLLHYEEAADKPSRFDYYRRLGSIWGCHYEKRGKRRDFCRTRYRTLLEDGQADQTLAIRRAEALLSVQTDIPCSELRPGTTVHILVQELNRYL